MDEKDKLTNIIKEKISEIIEFYNSDHKEIQSIGLHEGTSGILLLKYMHYLKHKTTTTKDQIIKHIDRIYYSLEHLEEITPELSTGLAGLGLILSLINKEDDFDFNTLLLEIKDVLKTVLDKYLQEKNHDILHGSLGLGLFFIDAEEYLEVEKIILQLEKLSLKDSNNSLKWSRFDESINEEIIDYGLAHGISGIIYFLGKSFEHGILKDECEKLIVQATNFLEQNLQDFDKIGSYYPSKHISSLLERGESVSHSSRFAWCYGDLGILNTLLLTSRWTKNKILEEKVIFRLLKNTKRKSYSETLINDCCFCHGTSGVSLIYLNCYDITGEEEFLRTSLYWLNETIKKGHHDITTSTCRYLFNSAPGKFKPDSNLLSGLGGVLLLYLSHAYPDLIFWKKFLFLQ